MGIDAKSTADAVLDAALAFKPMQTVAMRSISERAQVFKTTGYWLPRAERPDCFLAHHREGADNYVCHPDIRLQA